MFNSADQSAYFTLLSASLSHHLAESPHQGQCDTSRTFHRAKRIIKATLTAYHTGSNTHSPFSFSDLTDTQKDVQLTVDKAACLKVPMTVTLKAET